MKLFINVKHLSILTVTDEDELIKKLLSEFHFFASPNNDHPQYQLHLYKSDPPVLPEMVASKILPHALVYHSRGNRYIDYQGKALIHQQGKLYSIYCTDEEFLFELAFLTIHSLLGDLMEELGLYRIHALAGTYRERDFVLLLPSGGGKSSMLTEFLLDPSFKIISDDSPIIDENGDIHSFPTKLSLNEIPDNFLKELPWMKFARALHPPKYVLSLSHLSQRINSLPQDKKPILIVGRRSSFKKPIIKKMNRIQTLFALLENMVIGIGLPQVIEIFLNFKFIPDIYKMSKAFLKRSMAAFNFYQRSDHYCITLSEDIKSNCQKIKDLIDEVHS